MARSTEMRIDRLDINSYGHLRERTLKFAKAPAGLTIIVGPNEAGKSTIMRALQAFLFGIDRRTTDDYGAGVRTLSVGGRLRSSDGEKLTAVRTGMASNPLTGPDGEPLPPESVAEFFAFADRSLFSTLFFIDHRELTERSEQLLSSNGEIGRLVFGAGLGSVDLNAVLSALEKRTAALFKPTAGAKTPLANNALIRYRAATKDAKAQRVRSRDWANLDGDLRDALNEISSLRTTRAGLVAQQARLQRVSRALAPTAARSLALEALQQAEDAGVFASDSWAEEVDAGLELVAVAERTIAELSGERTKLAAQLKGISVDESALEHESVIESLVEGVEQFRADRKRHASLVEKVRGYRAEISSLNLQLQPAAEKEGEFIYSLTPAEERQIERVANNRLVLNEKLERARSEHEGLLRRAKALRAKLDELGEPPDTESLRRTVASAKKLDPSAPKVAEASRNAALAEAAAQALAQRIALGFAALEEIERLSVPTRARIDNERYHRAELDAKLQRIEEETKDQRTLRDSLTAERERLLAGGELPDRDTLQAARDRRDEGWKLVKQSWLLTPEPDAIAAWSDSEELPNAFERAVEIADDVADRRYEHAEQLTELAGIDRRLADVDSKLAELALDREHHDSTRAQADDEWKALWDTIGVVADSPESMAEWIESFNELITLIGSHRTAQAEAEALRGSSATQATLVSASLTAAGQEANHTDLDSLLAQADDYLAAADSLRKSRAKLEAKLSAEEDNLPDRAADVLAAEKELTDWQAEWATAAALLNLHPEVEPDEGIATLRLVRELRSAMTALEKEVAQLNEVEATISNYSSRVRHTLEQIAPDLLADDPSEGVAQLRQQINEARASRSNRDGIQRQIDLLESQSASAQRDKDSALEELDRLRRAQKLDPDVELGEVAGRSHIVDAKRNELAEAEHLLVSVGDGRSVDELLEEVNAYGGDSDRVAVELSEITQQIGDLDDKLDQASALKGAKENELNKIDGSGAAADKEQDAEAALAEAAKYVDEYVRTALAAEILADVIAEYGEKHQRPFLNIAAAVFQDLTLGAFSNLLVDADGGQQILVAERRNGERLQTSQLSSGTRDQLYLSLRLAGVRHHLQNCDEPVPLLLDDLLVNFDEDRATAALRVLAELGSDTQVLLFTHERSLAQLAESALGDELCSIVRIEPRSQDTQVLEAAPSTSGRVDAAPSTSEYANSVLVCLAEAAEPLGKQTILTRTGVPAEQWTATVRHLVDSGAITQTGQKRGAKYTLAWARLHPREQSRIDA